MLRILPLLLRLVVLVALTPHAAFAQESGGAVEGMVVDATGLPVSGATVRLEGGTVSRTLVTDGSGRGLFRDLPPGVYRLTSSLEGFQTFVSDEIPVLLGKTTSVPVALTVGALSTTVTVTASAVVIDRAQTTIQTNLSAQTIESLPKGVNMSSLFKFAPAARAEPLSGQFQIDGASGSENSFVLDGVETSNFRTGILNINNNLPVEIVEEMQVKTSGFNAEFGGATGGVVNVVTKSGSNQLHGIAGAQFVPGRLQPGTVPFLNSYRTGTGAAFVQINEYLQPKQDRFTNYYPVGAIGGPLMQNRAFFFASYTPQIYDETRVTEYLTSDPRTRTKTTEQTYSRTRTAHYLQGRVDVQPASSLRLTASGIWNPYVENGVFPHAQIALGTVPPSANFGGSTGLLTGSALASRQGGTQDGNNLSVNANWTPSNRWLTNLRVSRGSLNERLNSQSIPELTRFRCVGLAPPSNAGCNLGLDTLPGGNTQIVADRSTRMTVDAGSTWLVDRVAGSHQFKVGYQFSRLTNDVNRGYVPFGRVDLYYQYDINDLTGRDDAVSPTAIGAGQLIRFGTVGEASNTAQSLYLQDQWQPTSRLTINAGIRAEKENLPSFNQYAPPVNFGFLDKLVPRFGVAYSLTEDNKTKLLGSFGRFQDRLKFELPRGSFGGDFYRIDYFEIQPNTTYDYYTLSRILGTNSDVLGGKCPIPNSGGLSRCQYDYRISSNDPQADIYTGQVDPNLKPFTQTEISGGLERQLTNSVLMSARYIHKQVDHAIEDAGFPTADGSEAYIIGNPGEGLHLATSKQFGYAKTAKAMRKYDAVEIRLERRAVRGLSWNANYTLSRLFGNYSGLASSDEVTSGVGRTSPGVNRFFDLPHLGFTAAGVPDNGPLATDRPHVLKAFGAYFHDWTDRQSTSVSLFSTVQSGTPQTSFYTFYAASVLKGRGDMGRTPVFTSTDVLLSHRISMSNGRALTVEMNIENLFNERNVLNLVNTPAAVNPNIGTLRLPATVSGEPAALNYVLTNGILSNWDAFLNDPTAPQRKNTAFGMANLFQAPRAVRVAVKFAF